MNIFTKKLAESDDQPLPIDPLELYATCNYGEEYAYLRNIQAGVLKEWHTKRNQRDVICKMNTGSGKTLTGLLMLYSKLVELKEPVMFVCPDKHLVEQTIQQAGLYGIPVCEFENPSEFPADFLNSKKILVCNFHKLFNGKTIFNRAKISIGAIILDDAHKCVDIARENTTLRVSRSHQIGKRMFDLFAKSLEFQAPGTFHRLEGGDPFMSMRVPYWSWMDNNKNVIEILNSHVKANLADHVKTPDVDGLFFKWDFISDNLLSYDCYISGDHLEITPIHVPYHESLTFNEAKHRYILSATFEDDYDLIKDLGIDKKSIQNPIIPNNREDVGKRLILAPSRFDPKLIDNDLRLHISMYSKEGRNVIVLVPSEYKSRKWVELGARYVNKDNIKAALITLNSSVGNFMVFDNRYDGIDLNGDLCRVLVLDGLPQFSTLLEHYTEVRMETLSAGKKAQIIEQGLGRGVRSGADHCVVYLLGSDLISFLGYEKNMQYFTSVTRAQLGLGLKLLDGESTTDSLNTLKDTATLCLTKNSDWIKFHSSEISKIIVDEADQRKNHRLELAEQERLALKEFKLRNYESASEIITKNITNKDGVSSKEKAWYCQFAAQMLYLANKPNSNDLQSKACAITTHMFHPPNGHVYKKILKKGVQASLVKNNLSDFERPQDVILFINEIVNELQYTPEIKSKNFEKKIDELGRFLGFRVQMPDQSGNGPDNLWCLSDGHYLVLEAKSRATHHEITRDNIEQLLHSETWFNNVYGADIDYSLVTLQAPSKKGKNVNINDKMKVLNGNSLELLNTNLKQFGESLKSTHPKAHTEENLSRLLQAYRLTPALFRETYLSNIN